MGLEISVSFELIFFHKRGQGRLSDQPRGRRVEGVLHDTSRVCPRFGRESGVRSETPRRCLLLFSHLLLRGHLLFLRAGCSLCSAGTFADHSCPFNVISDGTRLIQKQGAVTSISTEGDSGSLFQLPYVVPSPVPES